MTAIVSSFIPVFNEVLTKKGKDTANEFASKFITMVAMISTSIAILGIIFVKPIVSLIAGGLTNETLELTQALTATTFPMIIFTSLAFSMVGILQSYGEYNIPAGISGISNILVITFLLITHDKSTVNYLCYFMVFAWFVQFAIQLPKANKFGYKLKFNFDLKDENIKKVFKIAIPIIISTAVLPINTLISTRFASNFGEKGIASLDYAYKLYLVISGVFTYAIGNIIFPELSRAIASKNTTEYKNIIERALRLSSYILVPLSCGIIIFSKDIVRIFYERGEFTPDATISVASCLVLYSIGIIGAGIVEIMNKSFYAKQDTKTPLIVGICVILINIILSFIFTNTGLKFTGLALANAITALVNALTLIVISNIKTKFMTKDLFIYFAKVAISAVFMSGVVVILNITLTDAGLTNSLIFNLINVFLCAIIGFAMYFGMTYMLKSNLILEEIIK